MPTSPRPRFTGSFREHWYVAKVDPTEWSEELLVPPGMNWIAIPPGEHCLSPNVLWFPSGGQAISYLEALRPVQPWNDLVLNPLGAQRR